MPDDILTALRDFGSLKVWSLVVTILGDRAPLEGQFVSGPDLSDLTDAMGVKPEALRVALHRLRNDGWVTSDREGRTSNHRLTPQALAQTASKQEIVYARKLTPPENVFLVKFQSAPKETDDLIQIDRTTFLSDNQGPFGSHALCGKLSSKQLPEWMADKLVAPTTTAEMAALFGLLASPAQEPDLATRLLALHHWRRLTLRHGLVAQSLMPETWVGHQCRSRVIDFLNDG